MPDITPEMQLRIIHNLEQAQHAIATVRNETQLPKGYQNFDLAIAALAACRDAVGATKDWSVIVGLLANVDAALALGEAGLAATAVGCARSAIQEMRADLVKAHVRRGDLRR